MSIECRYCGKKNVIKYGKKHTRSGKFQVYYCKNCKRYFSESTTFKKMRFKGELITIALDLYCKNVSLRRIAEHLDLVYGVKVSHVTILNWIRRYSNLFKEFAKNLIVENGDTLHVDEMMVNIKGKWYWWWEVLDEKTRVILSTNLSKTRETSDAIRLLQEAKQKMKNKPKRIVTDGLWAYEKAVRKCFFTLRQPRTEHVRLVRFFDKINNNVIERLHGSYRERTKVMRGFGAFHSARKILDLWTFYYNFIRPHQSIGVPPIEVSGISLPVNGGNRWLELIKLCITTNGGKDEKRKTNG